MAPRGWRAASVITMITAELKAARETLGIGPVAMAKRLGITYRHYQRLERGAKIREQVALLVAALEGTKT